jgi:uncharacterized membrane protein YfcA
MPHPAVVLGVGFLIGILSGLLGVGGGVFLVPIMVSFWAVSQHKASATSLAVVLPTAVVGSILYHAEGNLDLLFAAKITIGSVIGAYFGSAMALKLPAAVLKKMFGGLLVLVGIRMVIG